MNEFTITLLLGVVGFFLGGVIGAIWFAGFFPAAWIGLAIGIGVIFIPHCIHHID